MNEFRKPAPLDIKCTSADCGKDLHCFKRLKKMAPSERGNCRYCGADLVNWERVHLRDSSEVAYTFEALQKELTRHHFFHTAVDDGAMRHAQRKGRIMLKLAVRQRLLKSLAPAEPFRDGRQTPFQGNAIYLAQHATATCCRTCLEYWHAIPKGRPLKPSELEYCAALIDLYLDKMLPELADGPVNVPRRGRRA